MSENMARFTFVPISHFVEIFEALKVCSIYTLLYIYCSSIFEQS